MIILNPERQSVIVDSTVFRLKGEFTVSVAELTTAVLPSEYEAAWAKSLEVPTLRELKQQIEASKNPAWIIEFRKCGRLLSVFPFFIGIRKVRGITLCTLSLAGYDFYDYLPFSLGEVPDIVWRDGIRRVCEHFHADAAYLNHLITAPNGCLTTFSQSFSNACFDQGIGNGWKSLLKVESVKRVVNKAKRLHQYRATTYEGLPPPELLTVIANLHIERWRYDGVISPFTKSTRCNEYAASEGRVLCIVIFDSDSVIAASINMVFGNRLLWHTPVVNIEYLRSSPLKLLLHETISECARRNFEIFDFGLGDEAYKDGFCNFKRPMWNLFLPRTMRGYLASSLINWNAATGLKTWALGWRSRVVRRFAPPPLIWASSPKFTAHPSVEPQTDLEWKKVEDFSDFVRLCRELGISPIRHDQDRLKTGAYCLFATDNGRVIGKCWVLCGSQWSDPACFFILNAPCEKIWIFDAKVQNDSAVTNFYSRIENYFGSADLRIVFDSTKSHEIESAIHSGFVSATDVTIQPA